MTIHGGGGNRRIPPGTGGGAGPATTPVSTTARAPGPSPAPAHAPVSTNKAATQRSASGNPDAFEGSQKAASNTSGEGPAVVSGRGHSGVRTMLRVLEETRAQVLDEHASLQQDAARLVEELAHAGFDKVLLEARRQELTRIRDRMAALRRRLHKTRRRIKAALEHVGRTGSADLARELDASLRRLDEMKPGVHKALGALELVEQAFSTLCDDGGPVLRAPAGDAGDDVAGALSAPRTTPGAVIADGAVHLLRHGPPDGRTTKTGEPRGDEGTRGPDRDLLQRVLRDAWTR